MPPLSRPPQLTAHSTAHQREAHSIAESNIKQRALVRSNFAHMRLITGLVTGLITGLITRLITRSTAGLITVMIVALNSGCQVDDVELRSWAKSERGRRQLATYALDKSRSVKMRRFGVRVLAQHREYNVILSMYAQAGEAKEQISTKFLTHALIQHLKRVVTSNPSLEDMSQTAELAYILMSVNEVREELKRPAHVELLKALSLWPLQYLRTQRKVVLPPRVKSLYVTPEQLLTALLHLAERVDEPNEVFRLLRADLLTHIQDHDYLLRVHTIIQSLKSSMLTQSFAPLLLEMAREVHEKHPNRLDRAWFNALLENKNVTLLRFLIEICRDRQAPEGLLNDAIDQVMEIMQRDHLEGELIPLLDRVIKSPRAYPSLILAALEWAWRLEERIDLKSRLMMISPELMLPVSGNKTQLLVHGFCDNLQRSRDRLRGPMQRILDELKERPDLWPARLIAIACAVRLYPDDFPNVMRRGKLYAKYYQKDDHKISAWRSDQSVTISEIIASYLSQLR